MSASIMHATVWAGSDVYATLPLSAPSRPHMSPRAALYNQVIDKLQRQVVEEFGEGAVIQQDNATTYSINVDQVRFQRQITT